MKHYFKAPGQSSGKLGSFYNGGEYSPDAVLKQESLSESGDFWEYIFEKGNLFEALCYSHAGNLSNWPERFFHADLPKPPPDEVSRAVKNGDDLEEMLKLNKDGSPAKTEKNDWLQSCLENPGKMPFQTAEFEIISQLAENAINMPLPEKWLPGGHTVGDFIRRAELQKDVYWERYGIKKKSLSDAVIALDGRVYPMDFKYTESDYAFSKMMRSKYWIQALHYEEGLSEHYGMSCAQMLFVVGKRGGKKSAPVCQCITVDQGNIDYLRDEYDSLCAAYHQWESEGRGPVGWLKPKSVRIYV